MRVHRTERFDTDVERYFRWYLLETGLDPVDALTLAERFADSVDSVLDFLAKNPDIGRRRFETFGGLEGARSWRLRKPFQRFMVFYRVAGDVLFAERLLEGHSRLAGGRGESGLEEGDPSH